jgi:uncharacterized membrane protein
MENPFESGHIKNYVLLYVSIVVIMVLFFIASSLFNKVELQEKKVFDVNSSVVQEDKRDIAIDVNRSRFRLMDKAY